jgi:hypothetical protein
VIGERKSETTTTIFGVSTKPAGERMSSERYGCQRERERERDEMGWDGSGKKIKKK